jgi:biotin operon repressor
MMRTPTHDQLLAILSRDHIGRNNAVSGEALASRIGCKVRTIRSMVLKLRENAVAVCGRPETGYYIAESAEEVDATCKLLEAHGLHQLAVAARLRKTTLPELLGQLHLNT